MLRLVLRARRAFKTSNHRRVFRTEWRNNEHGTVRVGPPSASDGGTVVSEK